MYQVDAVYELYFANTRLPVCARSFSLQGASKVRIRFLSSFCSFCGIQSIDLWSVQIHSKYRMVSYLGPLCIASVIGSGEFGPYLVMCSFPFFCEVSIGRFECLEVSTIAADHPDSMVTFRGIISSKRGSSG